MKIKIILFVTLSIIISACSAQNKMINSKEYQANLGINLSDSFATENTVNLYYNLKKLSEHKIIFGHHDATAYGIGWQGEENRSDIKDVVGTHPGLYGWDFMFIQPDRIVDKDEANIRKLSIEAHERGGVNTFCWHLNNPATDNSFYDTTIVVRKILPGGDLYLKYLRMLDYMAEFANTMKDSKGNLIPIIFRPFHEFDGSWFWWGKRFCSREEFIELWQTTVTYLRDKKGVRNFIYAFSPDRMFFSEAEFLDRYPGDEYVDIIGMDNYWDFTPDGAGLEWITRKLKIITELANKKNKVAAFTETGSEKIPDSTWWTDKFFKVMQDDSVKIAYAMVWRNAHKGHHYAPFPGHPSVPNFVEFFKKEKILFEKHLPDLFTSPLHENFIEEIKKKKMIDLSE
ncbi:MAG: beta-mannosidase [Melioribacteraceae bacterium]|jgi:mannan endo-1,4-beta-mannosidase|nr:beta-mannosidase [Melioribacteraceae bacterium]